MVIINRIKLKIKINHYNGSITILGGPGEMVVDYYTQLRVKTLPCT